MMGATADNTMGVFEHHKFRWTAFTKNGNTATKSITTHNASTPRPYFLHRAWNGEGGTDAV
jgi:hypothetical protein